MLPSSQFVTAIQQFRTIPSCGCYDSSPPWEEDGQFSFQLDDSPGLFTYRPGFRLRSPSHRKNRSRTLPLRSPTAGLCSIPTRQVCAYVKSVVKIFLKS